MTAKLVVLVRTDLGMSAGKLGAQVGHAVECVREQAPTKCVLEALEQYYATGRTKIVLGVDSQEELERLVSQAKEEGHTTYTIVDEGRTELAPATMTCAAIGPSLSSKVNTITGHLKRYKEKPKKDTHECKPTKCSAPARIMKF